MDQKRIDIAPVRQAFEKQPQAGEITTTADGVRVAIKGLSGDVFRFSVGNPISPFKIIAVNRDGTITRVENSGPNDVHGVHATANPSDYDYVRKAIRELPLQ